MHTSIFPEPDCLRVTVTGRFTLVAAQRSFTDTLEAAAQQRKSLILLDGRQLAGEPSTLDRFYYAKFAALSVVVARRRHKRFYPKFAYVLRVPVLDPNRFGETVASNRGMHVRAFATLEEAEAWLGIPSRTPEPAR